MALFMEKMMCDKLLTDLKAWSEKPELSGAAQYTFVRAHKHIAELEKVSSNLAKETRKRGQRIAELEAQLQDAKSFAKRCANSPVGQMIKQLDAVRDALKDHADWKFSAKSTIKVIKKAFNGEDDG